MLFDKSNGSSITVYIVYDIEQLYMDKCFIDTQAEGNRIFAGAATL
ncbi:hypothetical protein N9W57_07305 [Pseudomonadales bacterium]|nr:hypothetical protein [Pseudomonadales bacterium]